MATMKPLALLLPVLLLAACASVNPLYDPAKPHHRLDGFANTDPVVVAGKLIRSSTTSLARCPGCRRRAACRRR
jgi:uncharacterized lipoprotein YajG